MEINVLRNFSAVGRTASAAKPAAPAEPATPPHSETAEAEAAVAFENVRALNSALRDTPVSRNDVIKRATELVGDVNYPPRETIAKISHLLAMRLYSVDDSGSGDSE